MSRRFLLLDTEFVLFCFVCVLIKLHPVTSSLPTVYNKNLQVFLLLVLFIKGALHFTKAMTSEIKSPDIVMQDKFTQHMSKLL